MPEFSSPNNSSLEVSNKDNLRILIECLKENKQITDYQAKGLYLEIPAVIALQNLGIYPTPLHNPFNSEYVWDTHLGIDLVFYYKGLLYGVECKNLSAKYELSLEWLDREIIQRFSKVSEVIALNVKVVVTSCHKDVMCKYLPDYEIIEVGYQVYPENWGNVILGLEKQYLSLFSHNNPEYPLDTRHGSKYYYKKLRWVQRRLDEVV